MLVLFFFDICFKRLPAILTVNINIFFLEIILSEIF